ncbi:TetR/AcrR family transcriptional regulator C-terminal domain-containing protein [bacterium]|nr:TetR/AcrR family transcriptional regulator C-terminal domain-containing protein [bacterium]
MAKLDRRIEKTRKSILDAFTKLITIKEYSKISIQDIIDEANVGRSTFYMHFETKDDLLGKLCGDLFEHIFNPKLNEEANCFIESTSLKHKIIHILHHIREKKEVVKGILSSEGSQIFIRFFKVHLDTIDLKINEEIKSIPNSFLRNHISGSFIEMIRYWIKDKFRETPEELAEHYLKLLPNGLK